MSKDNIQSGNEGEKLVPGKTENLSSSLHALGDAALPNGEMDKEGGQRGREGGYDPKTGEVFGSGSNAGGGGVAGEDYDQDTAAGSTKAAPQVPPK